MTRVALGGSLRNSVQVRKGAAWYAYNLSFVPREILTDVRTSPLKRSTRLSVLPSS
jgi:hypothetical protein